MVQDARCTIIGVLPNQNLSRLVSACVIETMLSLCLIPLRALIALRPLCELNTQCPHHFDRGGLTTGDVVTKISHKGSIIISYLLHQL